MNRKTLNKVIEELKKEQPKLDYVLGILETLVESLPEENTINTFKNEYKHIPAMVMPVNNIPKIDDIGIPPARIGNVDMSAITTQN